MDKELANYLDAMEARISRRLDDQANSFGRRIDALEQKMDARFDKLFVDFRQWAAPLELKASINEFEIRAIKLRLEALEAQTKPAA